MTQFIFHPVRSLNYLADTGLLEMPANEPVRIEQIADCEIHPAQSFCQGPWEIIDWGEQWKDRHRIQIGHNIGEFRSGQLGLRKGSAELKMNWPDLPSQRAEHRQKQDKIAKSAAAKNKYFQPT